MSQRDQQFPATEHQGLGTNSEPQQSVTEPANNYSQQSRMTASPPEVRPSRSGS